MRLRLALFAACLLATLPRPATAAPTLAFEEQGGTKGNQTVVVTFHGSNGNLVKVSRR